MAFTMIRLIFSVCFVGLLAGLSGESGGEMPSCHMEGSAMPAREVGAPEIPEEWEFIDSIPISESPEFPSEGCVFPTLEHSKVPGMLARYLFQEDTIYIDRIRAIYWPVGSKDGCKMLYSEMDDALRKRMATYYDPDNGFTSDQKERGLYGDIPILFLVDHLGCIFTYVNHSITRDGASGMFFPGDAMTPPLNVYGYAWELQTKKEVFAFIAGMEF